MKKIFTFMAAALTAVASWAQAPQLLFGEDKIVVDPNKTYETGYILEDFGFLKNYTQDAELFLKGISGDDVTVEVSASDEVAVCSVTGQCTNGKNVTKQGELGKADVETTDGDMVTINLRIDKMTMDMSGEAPADLLKNIDVEVKAYYTYNPEEYVTAKVRLLNIPASEVVGGVNDIVSDKTTYVKVSTGNILHYAVAQPAKLSIYNICGSLVDSRKVASTGSISLDTLRPGVYIYTLGKLSGKFIVK